MIENLKRVVYVSMSKLLIEWVGEASGISKTTASYFCFMFLIAIFCVEFGRSSFLTNFGF
jgi:hypothetical protein